MSQPAPRYNKGLYYLQYGIPDGGVGPEREFIDDRMHTKAGDGTTDPATGLPVYGIPLKTVEAEDWLDARTKLWI